MNESIPFSQKLYLLGIHPQKGGIISSSQGAMDYVLVGSLLLELLQANNIKIENKKIVVVNHNSIIPIHQFILDKLLKSKSPLKISRWINKLHFSIKYIRREVQSNLVDRRLIRLQKKRFLFFRWTSPLLTNKQVVYHLISDITSQVFRGTDVEDDIILLSFIQPTGLMKRLFPEKEKRNQAKRKLKALMAKNQISQAVADAIAASQAVAATIAATSAATS